MRNLLRIERFDDSGEVQKRAAESINFLDDHAFDIAGFDVGEQ